MLKPFRRFKTVVSWIDKTQHTFEQRPIVLNLFAVEHWEKANNDYEGFNDRKQRTVVMLSYPSPVTMSIDVPFEEFDKVMTEFHTQTKLLDDRSSPIEKPWIAREKYRGMIKPIFADNGYHISTTMFPAGYNPDPTKMDEALNWLLYSNVTPLN